MLFGNLDPAVDKFSKIEERMGKDIDSWLCNCYFEIEKINLMDVKVEEETLSLFYRPVMGISAQEQQQMLKMHNEDRRIAEELK